MVFARSILTVDAYVFDVLLRDLVGHDKQPAAFLAYVFLYGRAGRAGGRPVAASLRQIATGTGLSKSAVQSALLNLRRRELIRTEHAHPTAVPRHHVLRPWRSRWRRKAALARGPKAKVAVGRTS